LLWFWPKSVPGAGDALAAEAGDREPLAAEANDRGAAGGGRRVLSRCATGPSPTQMRRAGTAAEAMPAPIVVLIVASVVVGLLKLDVRHDRHAFRRHSAGAAGVRVAGHLAVDAAQPDGADDHDRAARCPSSRCSPRAWPTR
jgi:hypothetical protein